MCKYVCGRGHHVVHVGVRGQLCWVGSFPTMGSGNWTQVTKLTCDKYLYLLSRLTSPDMPYSLCIPPSVDGHLHSLHFFYHHEQCCCEYLCTVLWAEVWPQGYTLPQTHILNHIPQDVHIIVWPCFSFERLSHRVIYCCLFEELPVFRSTFSFINKYFESKYKVQLDMVVPAFNTSTHKADTGVALWTWN